LIRQRTAGRKCLRRKIQQLLFPIGDLIRMDAVARRDLLNGTLSLERFDRDLRLQLRAELPSVLSHVCLIKQRKSTLGPCPNFGEHLSGLLNRIHGNSFPRILYK